MAWMFLLCGALGCAAIIRVVRQRRDAERAADASAWNGGADGGSDVCHHDSGDSGHGGDCGGSHH